VADELEASGYAAFREDDAATTAAGRPAVRPGSLDELFSTR
jgi:hypothetical protein